MRARLAVSTTVLVLGLAACGSGRTGGPSGGSAVPPASSGPSGGSAVPPASPGATGGSAVPPASPGPPASGPTSGTADWPTYRSSFSGFTVRHPRDWRVHETVRLEGGLPTVTLSPPSGSALTIGSGKGTPPPDPVEGNVMCRPVTIGPLTGRRCLDTIARSVRTVVSGDSRWFSIAYSMRTATAGVKLYERVILTLRLA